MDPVTSPPQQSPSVSNVYMTAGTKNVRKAKRSRRNRRPRPTVKRPRPRPQRFRTTSSSSSSYTDNPSCAHRLTRLSPQEEVSYMQFGNPSHYNRFWETYVRAYQWQHQHQIAYWKSRAITFENKCNKLHTCIEDMSNVCQPNEQQCEPGRSVHTKQFTFPQYYVPNHHLQGQMVEQANNGIHRPAGEEIDQRRTNQYESTRPGSSRYSTPKINDKGTPNYFWNESNRIGEEEDNGYLSTIAEENNKDDEEESFEFEVNEEMMVFFEQSMKHKLELKEQRKKERLQSEKEKRQYEYECSLPPQLICKKRIAAMKLLYGVGAPKIIAMETAVKLTFQRGLRKHDPKFWPVIPLRP